MTRNETLVFDRTLSAVAKLVLFVHKEIQLTQEEWDVAVDTVLDLCEAANDEKYRIITPKGDK